MFSNPSKCIRNQLVDYGNLSTRLSPDPGGRSARFKTSRTAHKEMIYRWLWVDFCHEIGHFSVFKSFEMYSKSTCWL